jgi:hypothetical protein
MGNHPLPRQFVECCFHKTSGPLGPRVKGQAMGGLPNPPLEGREGREGRVVTIKTSY